MRWKRLPTIPRLESALLKTTGSILIILALGMILPFIINKFFTDEPTQPFSYNIIAFLTVGLILSIFTKSSKTQSPVTGLLILVYTWILTIICGSLPYMIEGVPVIDAIFESCSGFTTAGASIMTNESNWSQGIMMWRSITQWIGGIAIIFVFLFILPTFGFGTRTFFINETSGSGSSNLTLKMQKIGRQFVTIYVMFTFIAFILLLICGIQIYDAFCLSMTSISTGGFTPTENSLVGYSTIVKLIVAIFAFLGSVNFFLHYQAIYKRRFRFLMNEEFLTLVAINIILILVAFFVVNMNDSVEFIDVIVDAIGITTTSGFVGSDYTQWKDITIVILFILVAMIGGSAGSTSGGIKVSRVIIVTKHIYNGIKKTLHPNAVYDVKLNKKSVSEAAISSAMLIFILFVTSFIIGTLALRISANMNYESAISVSIGCITSLGTGVGEYGPLCTYAGVPVAGKIVMCILMWFGRLEIITALIIFTPGFWKEYAMSNKLLRPLTKIRFRDKHSIS